MHNEIFDYQSTQGRLDDAGDFPKVVLLDTVSYCNLRCSMCVHSVMTRKKGVMQWSLFTKIIDEIASENPDTRVWMVFFGEPFVLKNTRPSIFDMIAYAKSKGLTNVVVNSNANLMDKKASENLLQSGLDAIYIGIDAFTPETYAKLRVGGNYARTVLNVQHLLKLKKQRGAATPAVFVQFVEMDLNKNEKDEFVRFWSEQGASVKVRPKVSWAGMIEAPNLVLGNDQRWPCHWAMQTMSITDTGKVVTCAVDLDARFIAGDITVTSLKEAWNGKLKVLRQLHLKKLYNELPDNCSSCRDWQSARADYYEVND